jgi:hypothetical protein
MNKLIFAVASLLTAGMATAGVRIETVTRDIKTQVVDGPVQTVRVQDGKVQVTTGRSGSMILKNATFYIIDDQRKAYREMDKASMQNTMDQAGAAMKQMQERMKNMPPEQRAQMEKMMGANMPGMAPGKKDVYESKDTGKSDTVDGRKCRVWNLLKNAKLQEEVCVVPFSALPGKEDFQKTFKELAEAFEGLAGAIPGAGDQTKARSAINGYPVRVRPYDDAGKLRGVETVLKTWKEEAIPASTFDVPAGYKKQEMPKMGG